MSALVCRCGAPATFTCACGEGVCSQHVRISGSLSALRESCGRCNATVDGPVAAAPLPPPPVVTGVFTKDGRPPRQPWVKPKAKRAVTPGLAKLVEAPHVDARLVSKGRKYAAGGKGLAEPGPVANVEETIKRTGNPPKGAGMGLHLSFLREQAAIKASRVEADLSWFKRKVSEAYDLVAAHRTLEALALLRGLSGLSRKLSHTRDPEKTEQALEAGRVEHLAYLQAPPAREGEA